MYGDSVRDKETVYPPPIHRIKTLCRGRQVDRHGEVSCVPLLRFAPLLWRVASLQLDPAIHFHPVLTGSKLNTPASTSGHGESLDSTFLHKFAILLCKRSVITSVLQSDSSQILSETVRFW